MGVKMDSEKIYKTISEFLQKETPNEMIKKSFSIISINQNPKSAIIIPLIISASLSVFIGFSENTVAIFSNIISSILGLIIAIFIGLFTVYSIFFAFLSDNYLKRLSEMDFSKTDKCSYLKGASSYFESILFIYFILVFIVLITNIGVQIIPYELLIFKNRFFSEVFATILLTVYFTFVLRCIYELKSMIYI